jgi:uncharacterized protein (DUF924 family)
MKHQAILEFWFEEIDSAKWWVKDESFDEMIRSRFMEVHHQANCCELFRWRESSPGRLAEIIVLDQFSRNMFRGKPESFASDSLALALSQEAVSAGADKTLSQVEKSFLYMPFMHSESLIVHETAEELFRLSGAEGTLNFEIKHKEIIERFGRYPHRNDILGRESTLEEINFLKQSGSSF